MAEIATSQKTIEVNKIQVVSFTVATWPKDQAGIGINYAMGYDDPEGNFIPVESKQAGIQGQDFLDIVNSNPDGSINIYENIKNILYATLNK